MQSEWKEVKLEEVTSKIGDGLHGTPKYDENGEYYFINGNNLTNGKIKITANTKRASYDVYMKHKKELNDRTIFVSINGTLGNVALYNGEKVFLGKSACYLNVIDDVDKQFVRYILTSNYFQYYISVYATGTTIKNMGLKSMRDFTFRLPALAIQKKIAHILSTLDDKIELNRKMNQTLEEMAQTLFKSWFVDFDPVHAKAACKSDAEVEKAATELGIAKEILELFPSEFEESEMGMIPKGWEAQSLGDICSIITKGTTPKKSDIQNAPDESTIPFIKVKDIAGTGEINRDSLELIPNSVHTGAIKRSILEEDDLLFSIAGTIGRVAVVDGDLDNANTNQAVGIIRLKDKSQHLSLIWLALQSDGIQKNITSKVVQGVQANTSLTNLRDIPVLLPTTTLLNRWNDVVGGIIDKFRINQVESRTLVLARDTLLPKLLSGELDVSNIEFE